MKVWIDAQLSPALAGWMAVTFGVEASAVRDLGLSSATDAVIFTAARDADAVVLTKDRDFVDLLQRHGPPPCILWVTCGNTSNAYLRVLLGKSWTVVRGMIESGESLVEISAPLQ